MVLTQKHFCFPFINILFIYFNPKFAMINSNVSEMYFAISYALW